ncbi:MAG: hypothetical protein JW682_07035 [Campylobacterales bacterium]|nr:hypothetical protein [Campylobacterales bacterium]
MFKQIKLRTIIKNLLSLITVLVLTLFAIYDDEKVNVLFKIIVVLSPLIFSNFIINRDRYENSMRNDIQSKPFRDLLTYETFENLSIFLLLFINVGMLTGILYKFFHFEDISFIHVLIIYIVFIPLMAKILQKI